MITETMTDIEIYQEVMAEYSDIVSYMDKIIPRYRRPIIKSSKFPLYFEPVEYLSRRGNKYLIFFHAKTKKDYGGRIIFAVICIYNTSEGLNVMLYNEPSVRKIMIYSPHLFSRYRTRFLKDESLSTLDVIKRFFRMNATTVFDFTKGDEFAGTCNEGVVFGKLINEGKVIIYKTYVSFDMLFDNQRTYKEGNLEWLLKYRAEIQ